MRRTFRSLTWALLVASGLGTAAAHARSDCGLSAADASQVRAMAAAIVERGHAPGVVLDIRCDGKPWLALALGLADAERQRAMRQDDLFRIYSMTKPLTSLAVLRLAEMGRLSIDDPLSRHLPEFAQTGVHDGSANFPPVRVASERPLTVRDLLRHSAGIGYISQAPDPVSRVFVQRGIDNGVGTLTVPGDGSAPVATLAEFSQRIAAIPLRHQPGQRFTYGNATDVLGRLVEVVVGKDFREALAELVLRPLAMADTGFEVTAPQLPRLTAAYAAASLAPGSDTLRGGDVTTIPRSRWMRVDDPQASVFARRRVDFGGAGLVSTAADYQNFLRFLLQAGELDGQRIMRRDTLAAMTVNQLDSRALDASSLVRQGLGFGLGLATFVEPSRAPGAVPQGGYFWGGAASTYFWVDPSRRISGVLMTQMFGGDVAPYFVALMDLLHRSDGKPARP